MLAIVIPYYKRTFFEETLQSLANQTDKRFHVYIGDDASPESIEDLLERFKGQFEYTFKRFETNLGATSLVKQWERCIAMVQDEEWLMLLGDDDVLGENLVEAFYGNIEEVISNSINVIRYSTVVINEFSKPISDVFSHPKFEKVTDFLIRKYKFYTRSSLSEYIFKKEVLQNYRFRDFPIAWYSDDRALIDFSENKFIFSISNSSVRIRSSKINLSSTGVFEDKKNLAALIFFKELLSRIEAKKSLELKKVILNRYQHEIFLVPNKINYTHLFNSLFKSATILEYKMFKKNLKKYFFYLWKKYQ